MFTVTEGILIAIVTSIVGPVLVIHFKNKKSKTNNEEIINRLDNIDKQISNLAGLVAVSLDSINFTGNLAHETAICIENNGKHNGRHKKALKEYEEFNLSKQKVLNKKLANEEG